MQLKPYQQAAIDAGQFCAESDDCWWVGAEALVADDMPTPMQKVGGLRRAGRARRVSVGVGSGVPLPS